MSQHMEIGNSIQPLRNVSALATVIKRLETRRQGLPNLGVFYGPPGYGKTCAGVFAAAHLDAIHVVVQETWTRKDLLKRILRELSVVPRGTMSDHQDQVHEGLALANRPLLIDEADVAIARNMMGIIKEMVDGSLIPVVLIGMEELPQTIAKHPLVYSRTLSWVAAEPATLSDAKLLASYYAPSIEIADDLLQDILERNTGNARLTSTDISHVEEKANEWGITDVSLKRWGKTPFPRVDAPAPRRGLK